MTREEAIQELTEICDLIDGNVEVRAKRYEALNMAIEALKQIRVIEGLIQEYNKMRSILKNDN